MTIKMWDCYGVSGQLGILYRGKASYESVSMAAAVQHCSGNVSQPTWGVNDSQVRAKLVLDLDDNLSLPELMLSLQACILILNVLLH